MKAAVNEQAQLLGARRSLVAIVTEPRAGAAAPGPAIVLLNSGIVHRVGANRMSVALARRLAGAGLTAVRFDLSGVGDSAPRPDALAPMEAALADIREALDSLEATRGIRRVVLGGLCSGADLSLLYASSDPRVVGIVLLDPSIPKTRRHALLHYRRKLLSGRSWLNLLRGRNPLMRRLLSRRGARGGGAGVAEDPRRPSLQDPAVQGYLSARYQAAVDRGVRLLAVLTGERSYYREQLLDAFPTVKYGDLLRLELARNADHMFSASTEREWLIRLVVEWAGATRFGAGAGVSAPGPLQEVS